MADSPWIHDYAPNDSESTAAPPQAHHDQPHIQIQEQENRVHRDHPPHTHENETHISDNFSSTVRRSSTNVSRASLQSFRRRARSNTARSYGLENVGSTSGWTPGQEPGVDTSDPLPPYSHGDSVGGDTSHPDRTSQHSEITVVDYSPDDMSMYELDNGNLEEFLHKPVDDWCMVRWINVNGLSWDVIRLLGNYKSLHKLAIEDLMNTRNRTKVDWYSDHTYIVLALQKLVNLHAPEDCSSDEDSDSDEKVGWKKRRKLDLETKQTPGKKQRKYLNRRRRKGAILTLLADVFGANKPNTSNPDKLNSSYGFAHASSMTAPIRTLQRYHSGPNEERKEFMERNAILSYKGLQVAMEQVSIFLTTDNTVISFFESSAGDVEAPIVRRLQSPDTVLRQCCDASMLTQSIIDAIIDLAIPITSAYQDALGDLELEVLTDPDLVQSKQLYILTAEIATLRNTIAPIGALVGALKDHKVDALPTQSITTPGSNAPGRPPPSRRKASSFQIQSGVTISPMTRIYLNDVEDHCILLRDSYDQMRRSADNLVDVVFNTIGASQNESMKQLAFVTCTFLPLSFLAGYFGMNFQRFTAVQHHSDAFFWMVALPTTFCVMLFLMREMISRWAVRQANKLLISRGRQRRLES